MISFQVVAMHRLLPIFLQIKSRGQIVSAGTTSANLTLIPEGSWAPSACIIAYCVQPDGEVINDGIHLPIAKVLQNKVVSFLCSIFFTKNIKKETSKEIL